MEYKKFDSKLYKENNKKSIEVITEYLLSTGLYYYDIHPTKQPEQYKKYDFYLIEKTTKNKIYFEVERKISWKKNYVWEGYSTLDIPYRKNKSEADIFIMLNKNFNTIASIKMKDVLSSTVSSKKTIYTESGTEKFFNVSLDKVKIDIIDNIKHKVAEQSKIIEQPKIVEWSESEWDF